MDGEEWYDLPEEECWRLCMEALRQIGPRLQPADWQTYRFGHEKDALWLWDMAGKDRAK